MSVRSTFSQESPYTEWAELYDKIYAAWGKDYVAEVAQLHDLIQQYKASDGNHLLDLGCGTGEHLKHLTRDYTVTGLDATAAMLDVARKKLPDVTFIHQDMADFRLETQFDVILSLFSAIGYIKTLPRLKQVLRAISQHLKPGGVTIIEPWFTPEEFTAHLFDSKYGELDHFKACRMRECVVEGRIAKIVGHFMVASGSKVTYFSGLHEFGLFTVEEFSQTITEVGLSHHYIEGGLSGIGLHVGLKPIEN